MKQTLSKISFPIFWGDIASETRPAAALLVATKCGKFLSLKRSAGSELNHWGTLGGMVDPGETPGMAALRESIEEGEFLPTNQISFLDTFIAKSIKYPDTPVHVYTTLIESPVDITINEEHSDYDWVSLENWPNPRTKMIDFIINKHANALKPELLGTPVFTM